MSHKGEKNYNKQEQTIDFTYQVFKGNTYKDRSQLGKALLLLRQLKQNACNSELNISPLKTWLSV
jgi:hypothetical protein